MQSMFSRPFNGQYTFYKNLIIDIHTWYSGWCRVTMKFLLTPQDEEFCFDFSNIEDYHKSMYTFGMCIKSKMPHLKKKQIKYIKKFVKRKVLQALGV
jgi:hypothetical protein